MLIIKQTATFRKQVKKLHKNQIKYLNETIKVIANKPNIGESKKSDLAGVFTYKFKMIKQLTLLAYQCTEKELYLLAIGSHQNFYKSLKI